MSAFTKRNSSSPSELMRVDYDLLENKVKMLVERGGENENYYTARRSEIEMNWLEKSLNSDLNYVWHANMPLPFWQCREIFEASKKMPRSSVMGLIFSDYDLNADETALFDVIFEYGRARGLEVVATKLYEGAESGDPRAVKMYLDMMRLIGSEELGEDEKLKRLLRVDLDV